MALQKNYTDDKGIDFQNAYYRISEVSMHLGANPSVGIVYRVYKNNAKRQEEKFVYQTTVLAIDHIVSPNIYDNSTPPVLITPAVYANDFTDWFKAGGANNDHIVKRAYLFMKTLPEFSAAVDV